MSEQKFNIESAQRNDHLLLKFFVILIVIDLLTALIFLCLNKKQIRNIL